MIFYTLERQLLLRRDLFLNDEEHGLNSGNNLLVSQYFIEIIV